MYKYYSVLRPVSIGTYPKSGMMDFVNFDRREYVESINRAAWGFLLYDHKLPETVAESYDLIFDRSGCE